MRLIAPLLALAGLIAATAPAMAQGCDTHSGLPVPRFVSLKFESVNGRAGPSLGHPIVWEYVRAGLPLEVVAETADWRRVRDPDGEETWMHRRVLSGRRSVRLLEAAVLRARPEPDAVIEAEAEPGAVLWLERCRAGWCRLEADGRRGWVPAASLWGVYAPERDPRSARPEDPCRRAPGAGDGPVTAEAAE
ncbi:hypothetical protein E5163_08585 [Marinicauda algicola]|uniref:SH3b domain-containing protein n=1 Tax=Marinicauda algicola TaxID=2029849 RepID=A0A4V3RY70_9PROT|nr:SH3 domain-containing protein [Marinicauda algicola]TGY89169.1 hypothetical protein E5163_08585 [Marinicauda algicola]